MVEMGKLNNVRSHDKSDNYDPLSNTNNTNSSNNTNSININQIISDKNKYEDSFTSTVFA